MGGYNTIGGREYASISREALLMYVILILIEMPSLVISKTPFVLKFIIRNPNAIQMYCAPFRSTHVPIAS